jgi:colicin import membrane protein
MTAPTGLVIPEHTVTRVQACADGATGALLRVEVALPLVKSVAEVSLDVSERGFALTSELYAPLHCELEAEVEAEQARARFLKKSGTLRLELPLKEKRRSSAALKAAAHARSAELREQRKRELEGQRATEVEEQNRRAREEGEAAARAKAKAEAAAAAEAARRATESARTVQLATERKEEGNACFKAKDYAGAEEKYGESLRLLAGDAGGEGHTAMMVVLHSNRAEALLQLGKHEKAAAEAEKALALDPGHVKSRQRKERAGQAKARAKAKAKAAAKKKKKAAAKPANDGIEEFFTPGYLELEKKGFRS